MDIEARRPSRHAFWWVYSAYLVLALFAGGYLMIVLGRYPVIGGISTVMDAIGLCGFYGFLRYKPLLTQRFWIGFVTLYVTKLAVALALLASLALEINWDGSLTSRIVFMDFVGIVLGAPFLVAIVNYAFDGKRIWMARGSAPSPA
jgi:hypothetical protein